MPPSAVQPVGRLALTPDQAAEALGVSRDTLERHILRELRVVRRGRRILISVTELERWLDANSTALFGSRRG
jgi:excisionase family DNA binding protein